MRPSQSPRPSLRRSLLPSSSLAVIGSRVFGGTTASTRRCARADSISSRGVNLFVGRAAPPAAAANELPPVISAQEPGEKTWIQQAHDIGLGDFIHQTTGERYIVSIYW